MNAGLGPRGRGRLTLAALAFGAIALAVLTAAFGGWWTPWASRYLQGVDVSWHQGAIDWRALAADNVAFAYIKATEGGDWADPRFAENWRGATAAGHRPGGPNRPSTKPMGSDFGGIVSLPISSVTTVSTNARAQNVSAGGRSMSAEDLAYIQAQHDEASGLYEAELSFTALSMPNLKRGSIIQLTGIEDEDGSGIQCATGFVPGVTGLALIYSLDMTYDEPGRRSVSDIRAVWWEPAP